MQWRADFQSGSGVLKKVLYGHFLIYVYGCLIYNLHVHKQIFCRPAAVSILMPPTFHIVRSIPKTPQGKLEL